MAEGDSNKQRLNISLDYRILSMVLLAAIAVMFVIWKPWTNAGSSDRTITVTGEATVKAEPDEYVFYPTYEVKNEDKDAALAEVSKKSDEVVAKLKELGVPDNKIKTNASGYDYPVYYERDGGETTYTLQLSVTVNDKDLAQRVQDYLVTTTPTGSVSPQPTFSEEKRKTLESQARDEATQAARAKADQSAKNLGFSVGKVKSIEDGTGFGDAIPLQEGRALDSSMSSKLTIQPGENELHYSVTVVYYVR